MKPGGYERTPEIKQKMRIARARQNRVHWKGGHPKTDQGYILSYSPDHPFKRKQNYVLKHRLIIESQIGRYLKPRETSHHINGNRIDNRPKNLMAFKNHNSHKSFEMGGKINLSDIIFDGRKL